MLRPREVIIQSQTTHTPLRSTYAYLFSESMLQSHRMWVSLSLHGTLLPSNDGPDLPANHFQFVNVLLHTPFFALVGQGATSSMHHTLTSSYLPVIYYGRVEYQTNDVMCIATKMRVSSVAVLALLCSLCLAWGAEACVNGRRVGEACQCEPGWLGPRCDVCGGRIRYRSLACVGLTWRWDTAWGRLAESWGMNVCLFSSGTAYEPLRIVQILNTSFMNCTCTCTL